MHPTIQAFLNERQEKRLKEKRKGIDDPDQLAEIEANATEEFTFTNWVTKASYRAGQLTMTTHAPKFSHPDAITSAVNAQCQADNDGYIRTGNVAYEPDFSGNAAVMDVVTFLKLEINGEQILKHLKSDTGDIQQVFKAAGVSDYENVRKGLLKIMDSSAVATDGKVKQVFFPLADETYHLLSVLTPSDLLFQLKKQINDRQFSDTAKEARDARKNNKYTAHELEEFYNLTVIGFGSSKPQTISLLNSRNGGRAYLLPSLPPTFTPQNHRLPSRSFFTDSLYWWDFKDFFRDINKAYVIGANNLESRQAIDHLYRDVVDQVLATVLAIRRHYPAGWSADPRYERLPQADKIFLDDALAEHRPEEPHFADFQKATGRWITKAYNRYIEKQRKKNQTGYRFQTTDDTDLSQRILPIIAEYKEDLL